MISLIFLFRFSLIFKLIFVLACFHFPAIFLSFSCINFYSLSENFEVGMKIRKAGKNEINFRYRANFRYVAKISPVLPPDFVLSITFSYDIGFG